MALKKALLKIFNGSGWDTYYPKTDSSQVVHGSTTVENALGAVETHVSGIKDSYYHKYAISDADKVANVYNWITTDEMKLKKEDLSLGVYEVTYSVVCEGKGNGLMTALLYVGGSELPNNKSKMTVPVANGVQSAINVSATFTVNELKDISIAPKILGSVIVHPVSAFAYVKKIARWEESK